MRAQLQLVGLGPTGKKLGRSDLLVDVPGTFRLRWEGTSALRQAPNPFLFGRVRL